MQTNAVCDLGAPRSWQAVLDRAAGVRRLRDYACGLYKVVDTAGATTLYVVDEEPDA
jgi:hypothetical protein